MIATADIFARLSDQGIVSSGAVRALDELQAAPPTIDGFATSPTALVEVPTETATFNEAGTGTTRNPTDIRFRIFVVFTGNTFTNAEIEAARDAIKAALIGWTPDPEKFDPVNPVSAGIFDQDKTVGWLRFLLVFSSHTTQRTP